MIRRIAAISSLRAGAALMLATMSAGCVAGALVDVATAPVKVVGRAVDLATTSQAEADENRGRALRHREEKLGRLHRELDDEEKDCLAGKDKACRKAVALRAEIDRVLDEPI
jgi:hypothetical protein